MFIKPFTVELNLWFNFLFGAFLLLLSIQCVIGSLSTLVVGKRGRTGIWPFAFISFLVVDESFSLGWYIKFVIIAPWFRQNTYFPITCTGYLIWGLHLAIYGRTQYLTLFVFLGIPSSHETSGCTYRLYFLPVHESLFRCLFRLSATLKCLV